MVIIGVDPHPGTHTAAALDMNGKELAYLTVENSEVGLQRLRDWAGQFSERVWAIEGANNSFVVALSYALAERADVINISPNLTSQYRSRRGRKKNDEVDAANVARAYLANPELPLFSPRADVKHLKPLSHVSNSRSQCSRPTWTASSRFRVLSS